MRLLSSISDHFDLNIFLMFNAYNKNDFLNFKVSFSDKLGTKLLTVLKTRFFNLIMLQRHLMYHK